MYITALVIVTPMMKRAHCLPSSKDIAFVDSTAACDSESHTVTFMLTTCAAGAVPLAIMITKGQTYESYCTGFKLIQEAVPNSFNGQGHPNIFLTDQSTAEINAIHNVWPRSRTLLCIFHVLQAVWRWLWDHKHNIPKEDRPNLMKHFQRILYATSVLDAEKAFISAVNNSKYSHWTKYIEDYWTYRQQWCLAFRDYLSRGHHTNNFAEITVRLFKDNVLCRVKAYNVIALVDLTCTALEQYYKNRLREFLNGRNCSARLYLQKLIKGITYLEKDEIIQKTAHEYLVPSQKNRSDMYFVNVRDGFCSCTFGQLGKFCKHQCAIFKLYDVHTTNLPPVTVEDKYRIAKLALGDAAPPRAFYEPFIPLKELNVPNNIKNVVDLNENFIVNPQIELVSPKNKSTVSSLSEDDLENQVQSLCDGIKQVYKKYGSSKSGIEAFKKRMNKISSKGQWETFLHTAGNSVSLRKRDGASIRVQPTSISRRRPSITRGSKRLPSGKPASGEKIIKKRPRNLQLNISLNRPNAKSHGSSH